jgi:hypothetical protein
LVITAWELAQRYDANQDYALERGRRPGFDGWGHKGSFKAAKSRRPKAG